MNCITWPSPTGQATVWFPQKTGKIHLQFALRSGHAVVEPGVVMPRASGTLDKNIHGTGISQSNACWVRDTLLAKDRSSMDVLVSSTFPGSCVNHTPRSLLDASALQR